MDKPINPLVIFYRDEHMRESVKAFMIGQLEEMAVTRTFRKEDIAGIYEARELVDNMFDKLSELYEPKKKLAVESSR